MPDTTHLQHIRQEMPATRNQIYLNTGTFGPVPTCVVQAMQEHMQVEWHEGRLGTRAYRTLADIYTQARTNAARLLNGDPSEIVLTDSTGEGMNIISYGFHWQPGDEVITTNHEHISALLPLYQIRDRFGIVVHVADLGPQAERPLLDAIRAHITKRTRLIVLSHITWTTGTPLDVRSIAQLGQEYGIPVLVDGAQSAGAVPLDVKALNVDFYAFPMQKWLCGPDGTGALYIKRASLQYVTPTFVGYWSVKDEESAEWELNEHAQRFESGGRQTAALAGQSAALNWLEQFVDYTWLFARIKHLHSYAYQALQQVPDIDLLTSQPGDSGLVSFTLKDHDEASIVRQLQERYAIQIRSIPRLKALRVSTGFYNTEEEIDRLVQALVELTSKP